MSKTPNKKFISADDDKKDLTDKAQDSSSFNVEVEDDCDYNDKTSMLGHYITKEYELLRSVLSYLPLRDLHAAAKVCTTWKSAVEVIQRSRIQPHTFLWHCRQEDFNKEEVPYEMFSKYFYSEPQLCLIFMTRRLNLSKINCSRSHVPCPSGAGKCSMSHRVIHYVRAELEPECPCVTVEAYGVVGSTFDLSQTVELEEGQDGYSGVLLPKAPGISINVFQLNQEDCYRLHELDCLSKEEIYTMTGIPPTTQPIRCLLLFSRDRHSPAIQNLVKSLEIRQGGQFAVGGGFFENVDVRSKSPFVKRGPCILGIAFAGEAVHAASTILGSDVTSKKHVDEAMDELRSCQLPSQESVAFMFACVGRGRNWYNRRNIESQSFRRHFPTTPLVGFFGAGEIGRKFIPVPEQSEQDVIFKCPGPEKQFPELEDDRLLLHSYTSIIVYVSFNR